MTKTRPFLSTCYGYPSTTEVPPCCQAATKKLTFSTTSVLLLLNVPLSLSRGTVFRRPKNPRRGSRPKIAGILFVCNEPEGKYYTVPNTADSKAWTTSRAWSAMAATQVTLALQFSTAASVNTGHSSAFGTAPCVSVDSSSVSEVNRIRLPELEGPVYWHHT